MALFAHFEWKRTGFINIEKFLYALRVSTELYPPFIYPSFLQYNYDEILMF